MNLVLEWEEIQQLLREALARRDVKLPMEAEMKLRLNNKKGTCRLVFRAEITKREGELLGMMGKEEE